MSQRQPLILNNQDPTTVKCSLIAGWALSLGRCSLDVRQIAPHLKRMYAACGLRGIAIYSHSMNEKTDDKKASMWEAVVASQGGRGSSSRGRGQVAAKPRWRQVNMAAVDPVATTRCQSPVIKAKAEKRRHNRLSRRSNLAFRHFRTEQPFWIRN